MRAAARTDRGLVRETNQDTIFISGTAVGALPNLFMVADGMGGHRAGDYCSRMLVDRIVEELKKRPQELPAKALRAAIEAANSSLFAEAQAHQELSGMGSTLVAAFSEEALLYVFNIGDSRLYFLRRDGALEQVTRDHSYVEEMVNAGRMERGSTVYNQNKNIITRAVGIGESAEADVFELSLHEVDALLLCTDGLTNMLSDTEIAEILLRHSDPEQAAAELIRAANARGGRDNISVVLVLPYGEEAAL